MKTIIIVMILLSFGLFSCFQNKPKKENKSNTFSQLSLEDATSKALHENKQLLVLLIEPQMNLEEITQAIGLGKKMKEASFQREYLPIYLFTDSKEATALIDSQYIKAFPAVVNFSKGKKEVDGIQYGRPWPGSKAYLSVELTEKIFQLYQNGDKDPRLLKQLIRHATFLSLPPNEKEKWLFNIRNDYLNQFALSDLRKYEVYQILKSQVNDVRLDIVETLFNNRSELNLAYHKLINRRDLKNSIDADWMLLQAIRKSYEKAAQSGDVNLFQKSEVSRDRYQKDYLDQWIAQSICLYHLKRKERSLAKKAALQYFELNQNWSTSRNYYLMEEAARLVYELTDNPLELEQAESWIAKASSVRSTPTRYELHANILNKIGNHEKERAIRTKLKDYEREFLAFLQLYPTAKFPLSLDGQKVSKRNYKDIISIPGKYKDYYGYISMESSLYKKGEKIEAIAILSQTEEEVSLLSRVHLATGSILPVTHIKSYYVITTFSRQGSFRGSQYESRSLIQEFS